MAVLDGGFVKVAHMWQWKNFTPSTLLFFLKNYTFKDSKNLENFYIYRLVHG
jgi:hypothetical protein